MSIVIARPINGISANGHEFLLDGPDGDYMKFENKEAAYVFIRKEIFPDSTDEEIEDYFTFFDYEKLQNKVKEII